jgi:hypothetical protein
MRKVWKAMTDAFRVLRYKNQMKEIALRRMLFNRSASILFLAVFCIHAYVGTCSAQAKRRVLKYEPSNVTLTGRPVSRTFYGPPGYGEDPKTDSRESQYILILDPPVDVAGDPNEPMYAPERRVTRVTLVVFDFKAHPVKPLLGHRVEVRGTLYHAHTGHHHTRVLIQVTSIKKLGKAQPKHSRPKTPVPNPSSKRTKTSTFFARTPILYCL